MFKQLSYRQRIKFLPAGFVVALVMIYMLAIRETIKVKKDCNDLTGQTKVAIDAPQQMALIRNKLDELNGIMGKDTIVSGTDPLLEFVTVSNADARISLVDYQPLHVYLNKNYQIETRVAIFEGSYVHLLKFLYHIENEFKAGKVVSVKFQTETNYKTERKRLLMTLYIQSVKNEEAKNEIIQLETKS